MEITCKKMGIKDILNKFRSKKEVYNELKTHDNAVEKIEQSKLSSEERALNKILEKKRQEEIKERLREHYKQEDDDYWHKDIITQPNIFKGGPKLLNKQKSLIGQKNIFKSKRRLFA